MNSHLVRMNSTVSKLLSLFFADAILMSDFLMHGNHSPSRCICRWPTYVATPNALEMLTWRETMFLLHPRTGQSISESSCKISIYSYIDLIYLSKKKICCLKWNLFIIKMNIIYLLIHSIKLEGKINKLSCLSPPKLYIMTAVISMA